MSERGRIFKRRNSVAVAASASQRKITIEDTDLTVDFESREIIVTAAGVRVSSIDIAEFIRRERVLQAPVDGECRAEMHTIPGEPPSVRLLLDVAAQFSEAEALGLSVEGSFPQLVAQRIAEPVRRAILALVKPKQSKGGIILP